MEPDLIGAARQAGVTWDELAGVLGMGDRRAAQRRPARLTAAARAADQAEEATRAERLAALPVDTRPAPTVTQYDRLLTRPPRVGHDWDDTDVCLWRDQGRWGLTGPSGEIQAEGLGPCGSLAAGDTKGAQAAAAAAILTLTGREVTGWDRDEHARSVYGPSSWYACLGDPPTLG